MLSTEFNNVNLISKYNNTFDQQDTHSNTTITSTESESSDNNSSSNSKDPFKKTKKTHSLIFRHSSSFSKKEPKIVIPVNKVPTNAMMGGGLNNLSLMDVKLNKSSNGHKISKKTNSSSSLTKSHSGSLSSLRKESRSEKKMTEESFLQEKTPSSTSSTTKPHSGSLSSIPEETGPEKKINDIVERLLEEKTISGTSIITETLMMKMDPTERMLLLKTLKKAFEKAEEANELDSSFSDQKAKATEERLKKLKDALDCVKTINKINDIVERLLEEKTISGISIITEPLVMEMNPKERTILLKTLKRAYEKEEEASELDSSFSDEKAIATEERLKKLKDALDCVKTIQEQLLNMQLLSEIKTNPEGWYDFFLAGETIIPCEKLFSLIYKAIKQSGKDEIIAMQSFCSLWMKINLGSSLVKKAKKKIEEIISFTAEHKSKTIKGTSESLKMLLQTALKDQPEATDIIISPSKLPSFTLLKGDAILLGLSSANGLGTSIKGYSSKVEKMANDLLTSQCYHLSRVNISDFKEKLGNCYNPQPEAIDNWLQYLNLLSNFVVDQIVDEESVHQRAGLIKFFIDIACKCLELNDYSSAGSIAGAMFNGVFKYIPNTLKFLEGMPQMHQQLKMLNNLFGGDADFGALRERITNASKNNQLYIPYIVLYLRDIALAKEKIDSATPELAYDLTFNMDMLAKITKPIQQFRLVQTICRLKMQQSIQPPDYASSFINQVNTYIKNVQEEYIKKALTYGRDKPNDEDKKQVDDDRQKKREEIASKLNDKSS